MLLLTQGSHWTSCPLFENAVAVTVQWFGPGLSFNWFYLPTIWPTPSLWFNIATWPVGQMVILWPKVFHPYKNKGEWFTVRTVREKLASGFVIESRRKQTSWFVLILHTAIDDIFFPGEKWCAVQFYRFKMWKLVTLASSSMCCNDISSVSLESPLPNNVWFKFWEVTKGLGVMFLWFFFKMCLNFRNQVFPVWRAQRRPDCHRESEVRLLVPVQNAKRGELLRMTGLER